MRGVFGLKQMDDDVVKHLIITGVKFTDRYLGSGAYGRVFAVEYNGVTCAAKEIHSIVVETCRSPNELHQLKRSFLQECLLHSKLHHPNIVKMLGVSYRNDQAVLPALVMELMDRSLIQLLENNHNIPMYVKLSILQDVSRAICYLHTLNPPVIHHDLSSNNILLTTSLVAKVYDFGIMKVVSPFVSERMTLPTGTADFMPPEAIFDCPPYGLPLDVFSFGCEVCHVITQQWPQPSPWINFDPNGKRTRLSEVERRKHYIDQISEGSLKQLVITCLDDDQERRPPISLVNERITSIITG